MIAGCMGVKWHCWWWWHWWWKTLESLFNKWLIEQTHCKSHSMFGESWGDFWRDLLWNCWRWMRLGLLIASAFEAAAAIGIVIGWLCRVAVGESLELIQWFARVLEVHWQKKVCASSRLFQQSHHGHDDFDSFPTSTFLLETRQDYFSLVCNMS